VELIPENPSYQPTEVDPAHVDFRYGGEVIGIHRIVK
jgi:SOS-response transcriptional repressor LexA